MILEFSKHNLKIEQVYFCPHHPDILGECTCRKPKPGMILEAAKAYKIDLENSIMIGDKERDIEAGLNAGIKETYLFDASSTVTHSKATKIVSKFEEIWKKNANFK
jgi:D-glycero-D-manno-heptose 1,7-bisphosphate phosphatase